MHCLIEHGCDVIEFSNCSTAERGVSREQVQEQVNIRFQDTRTSTGSKRLLRYSSLMNACDRHTHTVSFGHIFTIDGHIFTCYFSEKQLAFLTFETRLSKMDPVLE